MLNHPLPTKPEVSLWRQAFAIVVSFDSGSPGTHTESAFWQFVPQDLASGGSDSESLDIDQLESIPAVLLNRYDQLRATSRAAEATVHGARQIRDLATKACPPDDAQKIEAVLANLTALPEAIGSFPSLASTPSFIKHLQEHRDHITTLQRRQSKLYRLLVALESLIGALEAHIARKNALGRELGDRTRAFANRLMEGLNERLGQV